MLYKYSIRRRDEQLNTVDAKSGLWMAAIIVSSNRQFARLKPDIELGQTTSQLLKLDGYLDRQLMADLCLAAIMQLRYHNAQ